MKEVPGKNVLGGNVFELYCIVKVLLRKKNFQYVLPSTYGIAIQIDCFKSSPIVLQYCNTFLPGTAPRGVDFVPQVFC
jgi:hypothetical protein